MSDAVIAVPRGPTAGSSAEPSTRPGVQISVAEWGDPDAPPILMAHGGFDFAETLDVFAPLLVEGGYRVVSWDQRGHGDSDWASLYSWEADIRDAARVLATVGADRPIPFVGSLEGRRA